MVFENNPSDHETWSIWCHIGIHVNFTSILHSHTPLHSVKRTWTGFTFSTNESALKCNGHGLSVSCVWSGPQYSFSWTFHQLFVDLKLVLLQLSSPRSLDASLPYLHLPYTKKAPYKRKVTMGPTKPSCRHSQPHPIHSFMNFSSFSVIHFSSSFFFSFFISVLPMWSRVDGN